MKEIDIAATLEHVRDQRPGLVRSKVTMHAYDPSPLSKADSTNSNPTPAWEPPKRIPPGAGGMGGLILPELLFYRTSLNLP